MLNSDERFIKFRAAILREVTAENQDEAKRISTENKKAATQKRMEIDLLVKRRVEDESAAIKNFASREISAKKGELRAQILSVRAKKIAEVEALAREKILSFANSSDYAEYLRGRLKNIAEKFNPRGEIELTCLSRDAEILKKMAIETFLNVKNVVIVEANKEFLGGFSLFLSGEKIIVDETFEMKLKIALEKLRAKPELAIDFL